MMLNPTPSNAFALQAYGNGVIAGYRVQAGEDFTLSTLEVESSHNTTRSQHNYHRQSSSAEVGTQISGGGGVSMTAQQDVSLRAAQVNAQGELSVTTKRGNVNIEAGQSSFGIQTASHLKASGTLTSNTVTQRQNNQITMAQASELGGQSVTISAGQDLTVKGSNVLADRDVSLDAGGNVSITAGNTYRQTGSDILTPAGDIDISAKKVDITEARETSSQSAEQKFKQSGLTVAVSGGVFSAAQGIASTVQATQNTPSSRMQALGAATLALQAKDLAGQVGQLAHANTLTDAAKASGMSISISAGSSSSTSEQEAGSNGARGSAITAGGNVTIKATGAGEGSDLAIQGSAVEAGGKTLLKADDQVRLLAAANASQERSSQSSQSGSIGLSLGAQGLSANASASRSKGAGQGSGTTYTNTRIQGQSVQIESGGDTTLQGAVVQGDQVNAKTGGNLTIESLQDTNQYKESSRSTGASMSIPITGGNFSASASASKSSITSNYASVSQQSGIRAGDGGFQVEVKGNTTLTGGQITSTQAAIDNNKSRFETGGTLTTTDLQNSASYSASASSVTMGMGQGKGGLKPTGSAGVGGDSGSASSTSTAGISGLAGNVAARTGDAETGIGQIFDAAKVKQELDAQVKITQEFNKQAGKAIEGYVTTQRKALQEQLKNGTPEQKAQAEQAIKDVNMQERALNILVAGLTGMAGSVVTKEALSTMAEQMRDLMIEDSKKFAGVVDSTGKVLTNVSGPSEGISGDGVKVGGTRLDLDLLCGPSNERCAKNPDGSLALDQNKQVQFIAEDAAGKQMTIEQFLSTSQGKEMSGATGGVQGVAGTLFGVPYAPGSWQDKLIESFAGSHDMIGGKLSGLYDDQGNATRGRDQTTKNLQNAWSASGAIVLSAPLAAAEGLSPEVWKAIGILLGAGK